MFNKKYTVYSTCNACLAIAGVQWRDGNIAQILISAALYIGDSTVKIFPEENPRGKEGGN
jgi:hypothetical protein